MNALKQIEKVLDQGDSIIWC